jgi:AcrR family transcriptional regulator
MSTKERILRGALALFNAEGYGPASALDVATALEMSPGHLYYHFKGKGEIALALFAAHEAESALILEGAEEAFATANPPRAVLETYLHILLEEMEDNRFLYREFATLARAHPALSAGYARLAKAQRNALTRALSRMVGPEKAPQAAQALHLGLWSLPGQLEFLGGELDPRARAAAGAGQLMGLLDMLAGPAPKDRPSKKSRKQKA